MSQTSRRMTLVASIALVLALVATGCTKNAQAHETAVLINNERARRGIGQVHLDARLVNKAQDWADHMARTGQVRHSVLTAGIGSGWRFVGENVGWARSVGEMHSLFMASSSHRAAILDGRYNRYGTGVTVRNGRYYVVHVFGG
jgi:uncharacterized protein YkwD